MGPLTSVRHGRAIVVPPRYDQDLAVQSTGPCPARRGDGGRHLTPAMLDRAADRMDGILTG
jgi:hypothetical protein